VIRLAVPTDARTVGQLPLQMHETLTLSPKMDILRAVPRNTRMKFYRSIMKTGGGVRESLKRGRRS
jgi:hypothetical protein